MKLHVWVCLTGLFLVLGCQSEPETAPPTADAVPSTAAADTLVPRLEDERDPLPDLDDANQPEVPDASVADANDDLSDLDELDNAEESERARSKAKAKPKASGEMGLVDIPTNRPPDPNPDPEPNEFVAVAFEPEALNLKAVREAINQANTTGLKGRVAMKILVDQDGYYKKHVVRSTPDDRLTQAVLAGVKRMKWSPATNAGQPVKTWVAFTHTFE